MKKLILTVLLVPMAVAHAQEINDSNTPLHLLQPAYQVTYGAVDTDDVKAALESIFAYVEAQTPMNLQKDGTLERGAFRLGSYEWGITYQALLDAAEVTGEQKYADYVSQHFDFIRQMYKQFSKKSNIEDMQMKQICEPKALDDCGTMVTAMMRLQGKPGGKTKLDDVIENYYNFVENGQYRLPDGTLARHRPQRNTIWLDDMYMGIPAIMQRAVYTGKTAYFDEATNIYKNIVKRMFVPEKGIYRHGYVEGLAQQPTYHWARANGWAVLTTVQMLDLLPADDPDRQFIIDQLGRHVAGLAQYQSSEGFWHQLLDRSDSYLETSATAIYTYAIAHAVNEGWLEAITYGPVAMLGWHALRTQITAEGKVAGTCVGTGMAFDPAFYYYRPVSAAAAHGYGPAIWAAAEILRQMNAQYPRTNDSGLHY